MTEEKMPGQDGRKSFGKMVKEKIVRALNTSHDVIQDTSQGVFEILSEEIRKSKNPTADIEYQIPILVEYSLYGADDTGRDLGEVAHGVLSGVWKTANELKLNANELVERTARCMILESDWRDIDLRIVIESFIKKSIPDGKNLVKKIYMSENYQEAA